MASPTLVGAKSGLTCPDGIFGTHRIWQVCAYLRTGFAGHQSGHGSATVPANL